LALEEVVEVAVEVVAAVEEAVDPVAEAAQEKHHFLISKLVSVSVGFHQSKEYRLHYYSQHFHALLRNRLQCFQESL
jgi:hypothetical protein